MALMVQGHTLDVLLTADRQSAPWYNFWMFCRGFTAPMFMTLAGFSFALATVRYWDKHLDLGATVAKRLRRFSFFVLLGYAMHFPVHSFRDLEWAGPDRWQSFLQIDVLQTIGLTLIVLQLLVLALRSTRRFAAVTFGAAMLIAACAPLAWNSNLVNQLPLAIRAALVGTTGSLFPMLPWSAYIFLGATLGTLYVTAGNSSPVLLRRVIPAGVALIAIGIAMQAPLLRLYGADNFWPTSPHWFILRVGFVATVLGLATYAERFLPIAPSTARALAEESLLVYFVHVCLLYGSIWNPGLKQYVGGTMGFAHAYLFVIALISVMLFAAYHWNSTKKSYPLPSFALRTAVIAVAALAVA
jgi:heparan-alpha-glucosaminide N-acetyltransferase-like protein